MNLKELRLAARIDLDDREAPYLWSDAELNDYANRAQNEACRRARLIQDSTTDAVTLLTLVAGEPTVDLDPRILFIRRAKLAGRTQPLGRISYKELDRRAGDWESETGEPRAYVPDFDNDMDEVAEILARDFSRRFADPGADGNDTRPVLSDARSIGSVIKLLTPSLSEYSPSTTTGSTPFPSTSRSWSMS